MLQPDAQAALTRGVERLIEEKRQAAKWLREISEELAAGAVTADAALRLSSRVQGVEHFLMMGRR